MTITLKVSDNTKEKMMEYFKYKKRDKTPQYAIFQADEEDTVVTLYQSGKVVFQGVSADVDANMWKEMERHLNPNNKDIEITKDKKEKKDTKEKKEITKRYDIDTIGSDEVGTGDFFGPIVVSSAFVSKDNITFLEELGVKDSKKLTDAKILEIAPIIIKKIPSETLILSNLDYNKHYSQDFNMNKIKAVLHNRVLLLLTSKINNYREVVVDQFTTPKSYFFYLKEAGSVFRKITFITKAESQSLSVACASIISRYYFLKKVVEINNNLDMNLPLGASSKVDEIAVNIVKQYGIDKLNEVAKLNFKNMDRIKEQLNK